MSGRDSEFDYSTLEGRRAAWAAQPRHLPKGLRDGWHVAPALYREFIAIVGIIRSPIRGPLLCHVGDGVEILGPQRPAGVYLFENRDDAILCARYWRFDADVWHVNIRGLATTLDPYEEITRIGNERNAQANGVSFYVHGSVAPNRISLDVTHAELPARPPGTPTDFRWPDPADINAALARITPAQQRRAIAAAAAITQTNNRDQT